MYSREMDIYPYQAMLEFIIESELFSTKTVPAIYSTKSEFKVLPVDKCDYCQEFQWHSAHLHLIWFAHNRIISSRALSIYV